MSATRAMDAIEATIAARFRPATSEPMHSRWLLAALHLPFVAFTAMRAVFGLGLDLAGRQWLALPLVLTAGALQFRHSIAIAGGARPRGWRSTLALVILLAYLPAPLFTSRWTTMQWFVVASCAMLLPARVGLAAGVASAVGWSVWHAAVWDAPSASPAVTAWALVYYASTLLVGGWSLYGAARLVQAGRELRDAQAGLAEVAVTRERLRISRDLHDLLGQSLVAVSLKGDLAVGLLGRADTPGAAAALDDLVSVARGALHDLRDLPHREPPIAIGSEAEHAADLLAAVGIETRVMIEPVSLPASVDTLFGWALREGVTNVLRHSTATWCTIAVIRQDPVYRLVVENDRASPASPGGPGRGGLAGLAARAEALDGTVQGSAISAGHFRLAVEVPTSRRIGARNADSPREGPP
jgi:two-component system sensor histidine kinase DesK